MLRRGLVLVFTTTSYAVENSALILIFLRDSVRFIWRDTAVRTFSYVSFVSIEKPLQWLRSYLDGVSVAVQYRACYQKVTAPMKSYYKILRKKTVALHSSHEEDH
jgi:hypothetical protein